MFDKELFFSLCEKYQVEMSDKYQKPMMRIGDTVRELTEEDVRNLVPGHREYFLYPGSGMMRGQIKEMTYVPDEFLTAC